MISDILLCREKIFKFSETFIKADINVKGLGHKHAEQLPM